MADLLDGVVGVLLYMNSKFVAVFMKDMKVAPVDDRHLRLFARGFLLGLITTPFFILLLNATMNILRKRSRQSVSEDCLLQLLTRKYMKEVSYFFFLNLVMIAPVSKIMVILMEVEEGDSGNGLFPGHVTRGFLFSSIELFFCFSVIILIFSLETKRKIEMETLRMQNLLVRSRLQMAVQRYLDETRHQAKSTPLAKT